MYWDKLAHVRIWRWSLNSTARRVPSLPWDLGGISFCFDGDSACTHARTLRTCRRAVHFWQFALPKQTDAIDLSQHREKRRLSKWSKKSLHWMCQRLEKMSCQKHCEEQCSECVSTIFPACVWPTPGYNDASFRIQIHALKKSVTTSSELCHAFAFKTRGKRRLWRANDPLMFQHDRDNTRNMSAPRAFQTHCWAIAIDQFKDYGVTTPSAALQSGLQGSFIATKRETTSSYHELNQGKTIEDGTRVTRETHYVFAWNLF